MAARGRPADGQHRRIRGLLATLAERGSAGASRRALMEAMGLDPEKSSDERVFFRDRSNLRKAGWLIDQRKVGLEERYFLTVVDHRLRGEFSEDERRELLRAAQLAGLGQLYQDLDPAIPDGTPVSGDYKLDLAQRAIAARCLVTFEYNGAPRQLHPYELTRKPRGWLLRGREQGTPTVKLFYVNRITDLDIDRPGTAEPIPGELAPVNLDPTLRREHDPVAVEIDSPAEALADVIAALGANGHKEVPGAPVGQVRTVVIVTFMDAFLDRLFELGTRVRLVGPAPARDAARARLAVLVDAPPEECRNSTGAPA